MIKIHIETKGGRFLDFNVRRAEDVTREEPELYKIKTEDGAIYYINAREIVLIGQKEVREAWPSSTEPKSFYTR